MLASKVRDKLNAGNFGKVATSGARIEILKRELKDGTIRLRGSFRRRGKSREYLGYISADEIKNYPERLTKYKPKQKGRSKRNPAVLAHSNK